MWSPQNLALFAFNTTADEMVQHWLGSVTLTPFARLDWSLFVPLAGGSQPAHKNESPQTCTAYLVLAIAPQTVNQHARFALPIQIQLAHTQGACSASIRNRCPWPAQGFCCGCHGPISHTESRWLVAPLALRLRSHFDNSAWRGQCPAPKDCLAWHGGMPGRPGPGFRLRCVQSVSVTW